ncbi:hypothetical protein MMC28_010752 [Mycoblastus sanguinarius]|nr:hypothetical protein [Mycoblastus sanguinarius]
MLSQGKLRRTLCLLLIPFLILTTLLIIHSGLYHKIPTPKLDALKPTPETGPEKPKPLHKPTPDPPPPIVDNFPLAATAKSPADIPPIPAWNTPPTPHVSEATPLFIGFTRNWRLLQQTVVSYITAGWPPEDIYVIDNTGTMHSNRDGLLTLQNPFYLDHRRLTKILGINVISTPTLFTFAQLQNFYTWTALERNWSHYFWAHMDTVVVSDEESTGNDNGQPYQSLYSRAVAALRETLDPNWGPLATRWFAYDRLALVRTAAFVDVGGWDTMIPFYMTDCDMHERLWMRGFKINDAEAGKVWDVASSLEDLEVLYKRGEDSKGPGAKERRNEGDISDLNTNPPTPPPPPQQAQGSTSLKSPLYHQLLSSLDQMQNAKNDNKGGRNTWQARQRGGQGEPFYRDAEGFERGVLMWMDFGHKVFEEKWGRGLCDIRDAGLVEGDAWRVVGDWENEKVQREWRREREKEAKERGKAARLKGGA